MFPRYVRVFTTPRKARLRSRWSEAGKLTFRGTVSSGQSLHGCRLRQWPGCGYGDGHLLSTVNGGLKLRKELGKRYSRFNDVVKPVALLAQKDAEPSVSAAVLPL